MLPLDHFHSRQSVEHLYTAFGICDTVYKGQFTVNDLGISYRTANYWDANGLMLTTRKNEKGWRKFNFFEYIWLNMVQYLRGFGFSVETIQHIKALCIRQVPEDVLRIVRRKENLVQPRDRKPNFLTNVAAELITCKNHLSLIYTEQGQLYVHHLNTVLADETRTAQLSPFLNYVSISLSSIYIKFLLEAGISVIQSLDIFPKELVQLVTDLRAGIVSDVSLIYAHDQVVLSSLYYTDPMDFARDCLRLATTTQYKRLELTYEPQPGGGKLLEVGSSPEVGIEKGSKRGAKRDAI